MGKYVAIVSALLLAGFLAYVLYEKHIREESNSNSEGIPYALSSNEIETLRLKATNGDCKASYRLALYYMYGALQSDDGLKWLRVAAKCPDANPKEYLIFLLSVNKNDPRVATEIVRLIEEIRDIDPARAAEIEKKLAKPG